MKNRPNKSISINTLHLRRMSKSKHIGVLIYAPLNQFFIYKR